MNIIGKHNIEIVVLATKKKDILTTKYLEPNIAHNVYINTDWEIPRYTIPNNIKKLSSHGCEPGPFRCFRGHQEMLKTANSPKILALEDDAVPNTPEWQQIVVDSSDLLNQYDAVSLHARHIQGIKNKFKHKDRWYATLQPTNNEQVQGVCWALAALAYLVGPNGRKKLCDEQYIGMPFDILLYNINTCILLDSPYDHDRRFGSVIENRMVFIPTQKADKIKP